MDAKDLKNASADMADAAQKIWLAGLGAVAMASTQGAQLFAAMVDKGKEVEKTGAAAASVVKDAASDAAQTATGSAEDVWKRFQGMLDAQVASALSRLGVPSRDEIAKLTKRVEELTRSIETLKGKK